MRVFVVGASGAIGSRLVPQPIESGQKGLEAASASDYLRPTTRFTLVPRASLLPGLGL